MGHAVTAVERLSFSRSECARILGCSPNTIDRLIEQGKLVKLDGAALVDRADGGGPDTAGDGRGRERCGLMGVRELTLPRLSPAEARALHRAADVRVVPGRAHDRLVESELVKIGAAVVVEALIELWRVTA